MKSKLLAGVALATVLGIVLPPSAPASDTSSIYDTLALRNDLTVMYVAATEAKEVGTLKQRDQKYTLFAPSDAAFKKLGPATLKRIATDKAFVKKLVNAHLVGGTRDAPGLKAPDGKDLPTRQGGALKIENAKDGLRVGGAKVVEDDITCSNGVIHVIDTVLPVTE